MRQLILGSLSLLLALVGCGSGSGTDVFDGGSNNVERMSAEESTLSVGQATVLSVDFQYNGQDVVDGDELHLVLHVPNGLEYLTESAEIDGGSVGDKDVDPVIIPCNDGSAYLDFELDDNDLDSAEDPSGDGEARLTLTLNARRPSAAATIEAAIGDTVAYGCATAFPAEDAEVVTVR